MDSKKIKVGLIQRWVQFHQTIIQIFQSFLRKMYRITLLQGEFFPKGQKQSEEFFKCLFQHFSLLSWLNQHCHIRIQHSQKYHSTPLPYKTYFYTANNDKTEKKLVQYNNNEKEGSICYIIADQLNDEQILSQMEEQIVKNQYSLRVVISKHTETSKLNRLLKPEDNKIQTRSVIYIDIEDKKGFFNKMGTTNLDKTICLKRNLKDNEIQYYYKEPNSKRNKESECCHFNLAFQGGGAKGVSYVGVYKALKEIHKGIPINSIIGSSAGGILALAISTEMKPEAITKLCLQMENIPKDKYYNHQNQITKQDQTQFDNQIQKIKCILHNQGILQDKIFQQLIQVLSDWQTSEKLLDVLHHINPSLQKLFTLEMEPTQNKNGIFPKKTYTKRFNYYGLLKAGLMQGNAVEEIAAKCLADYFIKHFIVNYRKNSTPEIVKRTERIKKVLVSWGITSQDKNELQTIFYKSKQAMKNIKKMTLKQLYDINEVELTCTSVDLDDKILRFFNHKTTPDLPACKTVQMSGSFPVAFLAQKWQKEWGKYYIHYTKTRKEIDLTGHTFTDGGLLANFPVKYLDNELMRPMYFSHKKNPKTILYGFGLDQIQSKQVNQAAQAQKQLAIDSLKTHISSNLSKLQLIKNLIMSDSKKVLPEAKLEEIPVMDFILKLFGTFTVADYNLNIQCFQKNIVVTEIQRQPICSRKKVKQEVVKFIQLRDYLQALQQCTKTKLDAEPSELIKRSCAKVIDTLNEFETVSSNLIEKLRNQFLISLYNYQGTRIKYKYDQSNLINSAIRQAQSLYTEQVFKIQQNSSIKAKLIKCITRIQNYFGTLVGKQLDDTKTIMKKMIQQQLVTLQMFENKVKTIIQELGSHDQEISNENYNKFTSIDYELIFELANMQNKYFLIDQPYVREILNNIYDLDLPVVKVENQIFENMSKIKSQLDSVIKHGEHDKIHLVLQSKEYSHFYFCSLFEILQNILHKPENSNKTIDMITTSDLQSVFAFLYVGGKKMSNIRKQMWKVKDLVTIQEKILQNYNKFNWAKTSGREMQELLELTWQGHYQIFNELQKYLMKDGQNNLAEQIEEMRTEFLYSKDGVTHNMEDILDYVTRSCYEVMKIKGDPELQKKRLAQFLSLKNGKFGKDYKTKNQMISENTQNLIKKMMTHFEGLLVNFILSRPVMSNTFDCSDPVTAEKVWKGALVKKLLSSKKLELYIKKMLEEMKLNSNTTLAEYYDFCPRKITLNFALVNKNKERVEMVNRFTRPNMPVWAAIIASTSMPMLLPDVDFIQEWQYSPFLNSKMRKLVNYFFSSPTDKLQQSFFSANYVSSLPLELLTNQKLAKQNFVDLRQKQARFHQENKLGQTFSTQSQSRQSQFSKKYCNEEQQYTFITFSFKIMEHQKSKQSKNHLKAVPFQKKFLNFSNLLNLGIDLLKGKFKNVTVGFRDMLQRLQLTKNMSIRLECHDNTIMKLYFDQTVKLPIQLGTLDFYKIQLGKDSILHNCIYQSQFVVRGIFQNLQISEDRKSFQYKSNKETYLQYIIADNKIRLKFISKSKWNRKLATMYRVFWKLDKEDSYTEYDGDEIVFSDTQKLAYLKFDYPDMDNLVRKSHQMILSFEKLTQVDQIVFFKFNFQKLDKRYLIPIPLFSSRLKTRLIPKSNVIISESKVQEYSAQYMLRTRQLEQTIVVQQTQSRDLLPEEVDLNKETDILDEVDLNKKKTEVLPQEVGLKKKKKEVLPEEVDLKKKKTTFYLPEEKFQEIKADSQNSIKKHFPYLFIKTLVNLKHDGLLCQGCVKPLKRALDIQQFRSNADHNSCSRCHTTSGIIGFECKNTDCKQKSKNRYCFKCLFVYLFQIEEGVCRCRQSKHELEFVTMQTEKEVLLCHFCQSAALSYYRDQQCNINLCFKCSLVLDSKKKC